MEREQSHDVDHEKTPITGSDFREASSVTEGGDGNTEHARRSLGSAICTVTTFQRVSVLHPPQTRSKVRLGLRTAMPG